MLEVRPRSEGNQLRQKPGLELGATEVGGIHNRIALADNGGTARELGDNVDAFNDGLRVAEVIVGSERLDLTLRGPAQNVVETQEIGALPVVTSSGRIVPVTSLADVELTAGPTEIRHRERFRTVTIEVRPAPGVPLEVALDTLKQDVIQPIRAEGLPPNVRIGLSGTADQLTQTWDALVIELGLAIRSEEHTSELQSH